jgi:uncharacterized protein (DUF427 family)
MSKSPGHKKWPDHHVTERHLDEKVTVRLNGEVLADSDDVIRVDEDGYPARFYFPRSDVKMERLQASPTKTECPFKGSANYFSVSVEGRQLKDAAWSYEDPYDEHTDLKGRVAFYVEKAPGIEVKVA